VTLMPDAMGAIESYPWPGNVRELENVMRRAVIMAETTTLTAADIGIAPVDPDLGILNLRRARDEAEKSAVLRVLGRVNGNLSKAAEMLGVSRPTLYDVLNRLGLKHVERSTSSHPPSANG
jgi:two-component system NtrC family response regulator